MRNKYFIVFFSLLTNITFSQVDSIQQVIINQPTSKTELISKGRALLLEKFLNANINEVKKIKDYLINEVENDDYVSFYPVEYWTLLYWTKEYNDLLNRISNYDSINIANFRKKIKPQFDYLLPKVKEKSRDSLDRLLKDIQASNRDELDKDFLELNLYMLLIPYENQEKHQDSLNIMSDHFLQKHKNSKYENFTRKYIRHKRIDSKWGFSYEFYTGYGAFTGELTNSFKNNIPFGVAFDVSYGKFNLYLRNYIGSSHTKVDIPYNTGIWKKDSQVRVFFPEASLGYILVDNNSLKVAPFFGISGTIIAPTEHDTDLYAGLDDAERSTIGYTTGINLDIKLKKRKTKFENSFSFLRIRYAYTHNYFDASSYMGNMHSITLGFGQFARFTKLDK